MKPTDPTDQLRRLEQSGLTRSLSKEKGLSFIHNDYLGLSEHPKLKQGAKDAIEEYGAGSRGSRLLGGHSALFEKTEQAIAEFFQSPDSLFFSTGYMANLAGVTGLSKFCDRIQSDEKNHASLIDAVRLSANEKLVIPHGEFGEAKKSDLLLTESLFSMDGDVAPLKRILEIQKRSGCALYLDEAHAAGVFGPGGEGYVDRSVIDWDRTVIAVTFGKAFGGAGAALLCSPEMKRYLLSTARSFIYTTAPAPAILGAVGAALEVVREESWRRESLWERALEVRNLLKNSGLLMESARPDMNEPRSPILAVPVQDNQHGLRICQNMRELGIELKAIRYPTVAKGQERIRLSINLTASRDSTIEMAQNLVSVCQASLLQPQIPESERPQSPPV